LLDPSGRLVTFRSVRLEAGWHPIGPVGDTPGLYFLRINGTITVPLVCP
jgi:hypothetical protein